MWVGFAGVGLLLLFFVAIWWVGEEKRTVLASYLEPKSGRVTSSPQDIIVCPSTLTLLVNFCDFYF